MGGLGGGLGGDAMGKGPRKIRLCWVGARVSPGPHWHGSIARRAHGEPQKRENMFWAVSSTFCKTCSRCFSGNARSENGLEHARARVSREECLRSRNGRRVAVTGRVNVDFMLYSISV